MRFPAFRALSSVHVHVYCRRILAARHYGAIDHQLLACEMRADIEAGLDPELVIRRHWCRALLFARAQRPSNKANIAELLASITTKFAGPIA